MKNYLLTICQRLGIPPSIWMIHNPIKIYEYLMVTQSISLKLDDTVLDLGCGSGVWTMDLARHGHKVMGVDISRDAISAARKYIRNSSLKNRLDFKYGELKELRFSEESLDHIFCYCVLEHIGDLVGILAEIKRILRSGGCFHVSVDSLATINDATIIAKHQRDHAVIRYFSVDSLRDNLTRAGLVVQSIYPILKGELARQEFQKRILGHHYQVGWFSRKKMVKRLMQDDDQQKNNEGIMIIAHASCP